MFYIVFDFMMAVIMFLFGMWFYKSEGKATKFLSGYNMKSADERKKYDENAMCKAYGKRMMFMSDVLYCFIGLSFPCFALIRVRKHSWDNIIQGFIIQCEGLDEATGEKEYTMLWKRK